MEQPGVVGLPAEERVLAVVVPEHVAMVGHDEPTNQDDSRPARPYHRDAHASGKLLHGL